MQGGGVFSDVVQRGCGVRVLVQQVCGGEDGSEVDGGDGGAGAGRRRVEVQAVSTLWTATHLGCTGQQELLFAPYSVFTVLQLHVPANPSDDDPVTVGCCAQ